MKKKIVAMALLSTICIGGCKGWLPGPEAPLNTPNHLQPGDTCQEDDECWDCNAMGNNICGDTNHDGHLSDIELGA